MPDPVEYQWMIWDGSIPIQSKWFRCPAPRVGEIIVYDGDPYIVENVEWHHERLEETEPGGQFKVYVHVKEAE
jgi:hypothetical protein